MANRAPSQLDLRARRAHTLEPDPARAVAILAEELEADGASAVLLFCSGDYDLAQLGRAIERTIGAPVAACTSAGQLGPSGFERGGITGVSLTSADLYMRPLLLSPLALCQAQAASLAREQAARAAAGRGLRSFGLLLVDGLSLWEEYVASALYQAFGDVPLVGGSAGSRPGCPEPAVYHAGHFIQAAAVLCLFETRSLRFGSFAAQHFVPSETKLVITSADADRRIVHELNGEPAARAYADALGQSSAELGSRTFALHPLLLDMGHQLLPRAIRAHAADGSLTMACAIEEGLVLSVANGTDPIAALERTLSEVEQRVPDAAALLVFDCVLRRIELETRGLDAAVGELLARKGAVGFSSFGEQLGPLHVNHTLTGMALGTHAVEVAH
jgi:hypothetical protein